MKLTVPGWGSVELNNLILDFNGTIAVDGVLIERIKKQIVKLSETFNIYVITADTNGSVIKQCADLPVKVHIVSPTRQKEEKREFVLQLAEQGTVSIGNGNIDTEMFSVSELAIAVIEREGCTIGALLKSDIVVNNIDDALGLLINENRLIATLRQ